MHSKNAAPPFTSIFTVGLIRIFLLIILVIVLRNRLWLPGSLLLLLLFTVEGALWWSKLGLKKVYTQKALFPLRAFPGEKVELRVRVTNNKYLPAHINWQQNLPEGICFVKNEQQSIIENLTLFSHGKYSFSREIQTKKRGVFAVPGSRLVFRDGLGLFYQERTEKDANWLIVYPQIIELHEQDIRAADLIGEQRDNRPMLPDPIRIAGLREYTPEMPARLIHWKASVNRDNLLAKIIEPTADYKIYLLIDVNYFYETSSEENFEKALSIAASLLVWADEKNIPFGMLVNGLQQGLDGPVVLNSGSGINHLLLALEKLARLIFTPSGSLEELLQLAVIGTGYGTSYISLGRELDGRILLTRRMHHYRI